MINWWNLTQKVWHFYFFLSVLFPRWRGQKSWSKIIYLLGCFLFWQIRRYQKACVKSWRFGSFRAPHQNFSLQFPVTWFKLSSFSLSYNSIFHTKRKSCQASPILILFSNFWCRPHFILNTHDITSSFHQICAYFRLNWQISVHCHPSNILQKNRPRISKKLPSLDTLRVWQFEKK
jgi:hypothetical protein